MLAELKAEHEQDIPEKKVKVFNEMRPGDAIEIKVPKPSAKKTPMIHRFRSCRCSRVKRSRNGSE